MQRDERDLALVKVVAWQNANAKFDGVAVNCKSIGNEYLVRRSWIIVRIFAQAGKRQFAGRLSRLTECHRFDPRLRHVAVTAVEAAATCDRENDRCWPVTTDRVRNADKKLVTMDNLFAQEFVAVNLACGQFRCAENYGWIRSAECECTVV